ncbi:AGAP012267-PA, partial [Anopheles gambiae str. PEST]
KGTESSSESVESNESSSKETTVEGNNAAEVTEEDTNTAQEVTVPENSVNGTVKLEQPTKPVDQTTTVVAKSSVSTNAAPVPELTKEQVRPTQPKVEVTEVTQKVNDLPTVEVTVTLAERESVDLRVETNEPVPVTTDSVAAEV